jgi:hypothetical protein
MVQADSLAPASLISAMESGKFYATNGVVLKTVKFEGNELKVEIQGEPDINYSMKHPHRGHGRPEWARAQGVA